MSGRTGPVMASHPRPTVQNVTQLLSSYLPSTPKDVPFEYHVPRMNRPPLYVNRTVFSITPTEGVYTAIHVQSRHPPVVFLHRPFELDRRRVRRGCTVLSSHKAFDEVLTVGYNVELASRLGVLGDTVCLQGYKNDAERKIGLVGSVTSDVTQILERITAEFGSVEATNLVESQSVTCLAIMNAFDEEQVQRVMVTAQERGWVDETGSSVLYLTGAARPAGLEAAQKVGMHVVCVGHRVCEEWGIHYLAEKVRSCFPTMQVEEIYEDEPPKVRDGKELTALEVRVPQSPALQPPHI